jgi:hypothetical protein
VVATEVRPISAPADDPQRRPAVVHPDARLNTFLQHDLLRGVSNTLVSQPSLIRPWSKSSGHWDRSVGDDGETALAAGVRHAPRAWPLVGRGSDRHIAWCAGTQSRWTVHSRRHLWVVEQSFAWLSHYRRLNTSSSVRRSTSSLSLRSRSSQSSLADPMPT